MADIFKEQLIKREPNFKDSLTKAALVVGALLLFLAAVFFIPGLGLLVGAAVAFGAYVLAGRLNKEYEYIFTNGELDIDIIYNKSSRKRVFTGYVKDFELMAHIDDASNQNSINSANEKLDYSSGVPSERSYVFLTNYDSKRVAIIIEPNDEMLEVITKVLTRRKFYPKK